MSLTYVLDIDGQPLMPTSRNGKVRRLLRDGLALVIKRCPFTIQLTYEPKTHETQPIHLGVDAGSKYIGLSAVTEAKELYAAEVAIRNDISKLMTERRALRSSRRNRKTRYRKAKFNNRKKTKPKGWLAPSIVQKVNTHLKVIADVYRLLPVTKLTIEVAAFDTQKMVNPEISGIEYQQGELQGYEIREYLLEKFGRRCMYCKKKNIPLEIEHMTPKARGGSNRVFNLTTACHNCNQEKGTMTASEFGYPHLEKKGQQTLKYAAHMNLVRWAVWNQVKERYPNAQLTYGYETKAKRYGAELEKSHSVDARCIADGMTVQPLSYFFNMKKVRCHNRKLHKTKFIKGGKRKNNQAPQFVFGYQLFDQVEYEGKTYFIFGRRTSGRFDIRTLDGQKVNNGSVSYKKLKLITKARHYLTERKSR